jgi:hypothetical protein
MIDRFEILVEDASTEAMLRSLLPRFLRPEQFEIHPHQGKPDLLANLESRLRAYARWLPSTTRVIVLVDRDHDDCHELKRRILVPRVTSRLLGGGGLSVVTRIAIEELEAWYFGDWEAVRQAYPRLNATIPRKSAYRDPDAISGGTWEAFERLLKAAGYMKGGLRKTEAGREIGKYLEPGRNTSTSFGHFWRALSFESADTASVP